MSGISTHLNISAALARLSDSVILSMYTEMPFIDRPSIDAIVFSGVFGIIVK